MRCLPYVVKYLFRDGAAAVAAASVSCRSVDEVTK